MLSIAKHSAAELTFSLVGLLDGAWVCVALETLQTLLLASKKGLWVETAGAASSLGRFSAAVPTKGSLEMREKRSELTSNLHVTSDGERAVVSPVYDEVVHVHGDGRGLRIGGTVPGTGVLERYTFSLSKALHSPFTPIRHRF